MKKRVIIVTNAFPFGYAEASFIRPELQYLSEIFDLTVIARNSKDGQTTELNPSIDIFRYNASELRIADCIKCAVKVNKSRLFHELRKRALGKKNKIKALKFALRAVHFAEYAKRVRLLYSQEVIFYCYWNDYAAYGVCQLCEKSKDKCISRIHGGDLYELPFNNYYQPFKEVMADLFSKIVFVSNAGMDYFVNTYRPAATSNLAVSYMGVDNDTRIRNLPSSDGVLRILSLSNINEVKRVHKIPEALSAVSDVRILWTHIGAGELSDEVKAKASELLDSKSNIEYRFLGRITNEEVKEYFVHEHVDILINTSMSEGLPVSMMEAASYGIPIIATNVGGVSEIVTDSNGFVLDRDFEGTELASVIQSFYRLSDEEKDMMRDDSYNVWLEKFNAKKNHERFAEGLAVL